MARSVQSPDYFLKGILEGNRVVLGQAITLVESTRPEHQSVAAEVAARLRAAKPETNSFRIGVTGAPGVGKSTFIEAMGMFALQKGKKVAVLAIDPSSQISRGSILGDKTRMEQLSAETNAFIRPSPSGNSLGGVARKTRETILMVEAAGFDTVFVETVGVGQSEMAVHSMTDVFLLLLLPGAGDELQGIKRGIVEMADIVVVNKADGERIHLAKQALQQYAVGLHLLPSKDNLWTPKILTCSALEKRDIDKVWAAITGFQEKNISSGWLTEHRRQQAHQWFLDAIHTGLEEQFFQNPDIQQFLKNTEPAVLAGDISPFVAAQSALKIFFEGKND